MSDGRNRNDEREPVSRGTPTPADQIGEAAGGISGAVSGAAIGAIGGPVGSLIGGIAGAIGGWWIGRGISDAASGLTDEDEDYYRQDFDRRSSGEGSFDSARPGYQLGHYASFNPEYAGRAFDEIEPDLRRGWDAQPADTRTDWATITEYAREGFRRGRHRTLRPAGDGPAIVPDAETEDRNTAAIEAATAVDDRPGARQTAGTDLSPELLDYAAHDGGAEARFANPAGEKPLDDDRWRDGSEGGSGDVERSADRATEREAPGTAGHVERERTPDPTADPAPDSASESTGGVERQASAARHDANVEKLRESATERLSGLSKLGGGTSDIVGGA